MKNFIAIITLFSFLFFGNYSLNAQSDTIADSNIVEKLMIKDFLVARRTVAKYRKILNIKNANQRKE